jgi:hypothetical protein
MILNNDNYFSQEAGKEYLSVSQFKSFQKCEFSAYAQILGKYKRPITDALLVGSYVDSYFSGTFDEWKEKHNAEICGKTGKLRSPFVKADIMISRIQQDDLFMSSMQGLKQQVLIADINGIKWKCLPDFIDEFSGICFDLKTTRSFELVWSDTLRRKVEFYENFNYFLQLAVYQLALLQKYDKTFDMAISAVTKEPVPDIKIIKFSSDECLDRFESELSIVKEYQGFIVDVKAGKVPVEKLRRCESCNYCKKTKILTDFEPAVVI